MRSYFLIIYLVALPFIAHAALMPANDTFFGDGSLTIDTSTNLAWLDLSITAGISFNEVSNELGNGGIYSGYRFASLDEVFSLYVEAQIPDINDVGDFGIGTIANAAPALALIELMGPSSQTHAGVILSEIAGFSSQHVFMNGFDLIQMPDVIVREGVTFDGGTESFGEAFTTGTWILPGNSYEGVGSWLVKPAVVPITPAIWLFGSGLIGLIGFARRKTLN